jgi:hypothetical protein
MVILVNITGLKNNTFAIIAKCYRRMKEEGMVDTYWKMAGRLSRAKNHSMAMKIMREYVQFETGE